MRRRDFFKKSLAGLGAIGVSLSLKGCSVHEESSPFGRVVNEPDDIPSIRKLVEDVNLYLGAVFTHTMSLHKRRCLEVTAGIVKEASYSIVAILNRNVGNFSIIKCEITKTYGQVWYEAKFTIGKHKVENYKSAFYFQLLGGPGDPVHIERVDKGTFNCFVEKGRR